MAQIEIMEVKEFSVMKQVKSWKGIKKNYKAANGFVILT